MPHLQPDLPALRDAQRQIEASWLPVKPQPKPTPWPLIQRRSLRRLVARIRRERQ